MAMIRRAKLLRSSNSEFLSNIIRQEKKHDELVRTIAEYKILKEELLKALELLIEAQQSSLITNKPIQSN
jgi:hypothetical protein